MANYFFDSSAIVKRYVLETGSGWVNSIVLGKSNRIHVARIGGVEVVAALTRRLLSSANSAPLAAALGQFRFEFTDFFLLVAMTPRVLDQAMSLAEQHALRGYDAVQLAAGLQLHGRLSRRNTSMTFISADMSLNNAARAEGLTVDDPNLHP